MNAGYMADVIADHFNLPSDSFHPVPVPEKGEEMEWYKALARKVKELDPARTDDDINLQTQSFMTLFGGDPLYL